MRTILVVVLYNKTYKDSLTLNCLMSKDYIDIDVLIINNGPTSLEFDKNFIHTLGFYVRNIEIKQFLDNRPLSWLYNGVINEYRDYDRFMLFDDDSALAKDLITKIDSYWSDDIDLQIPNIKETSDGKIYYPRIDKEPKSFSDGEVIESRYNVLSISSGLVIYRSLIDKFSEMGLEVFDSRFALYGVDYSFFNRLELLKRKNVAITIQIVGTLEHSLSRIEDSKNTWRSTERLYDSVLSVKYYSNNKFVQFMRLLKLAVNQLLKFKFANIELIIKTYMNGKHPRC